jgi:hypothetical protein
MELRNYSTLNCGNFMIKTVELEQSNLNMFSCELLILGITKT